MRIFHTALFALMLAWLVSGGGLPCLAQDRIVVAGTGDSIELFQSLSEAFERAHPGKKIEIPPSIDSGGGIRAVSKGLCDLGRVARKPRENEKKYAVQYKALAHVPLVFVMNPSITRVEDLTEGQVLGILTGDLTNWKDVGGPEGKIYVVQREFGDSARTLLEKRLPGFKDLPELTGFTAYSAAEALKAIRDNKNTIGYIAYGAAQKTDLKILRINGITPTTENIRDGRYKLVLTVGYVWKGELNDLAKSFFDFCYGRDGYSILVNNGAVPAFEPK